MVCRGPHGVPRHDYRERGDVWTDELGDAGEADWDLESTGCAGTPPRSRLLISGGTGNGPATRHFMQAEQVTSAFVPFSFGHTQAPLSHLVGVFVWCRNTRSIPGGTSFSSSG